MGSVQLPLEVWEAVRILKEKIQSAPVLVFPNFVIPFLLETDPSKEVGCSAVSDTGQWLLSSCCLRESLPHTL